MSKGLSLSKLACWLCTSIPEVQAIAACTSRLAVILKVAPLGHQHYIRFFARWSFQFTSCPLIYPVLCLFSFSVPDCPVVLPLARLCGLFELRFADLLGQWIIGPVLHWITSFLWQWIIWTALHRFTSILYLWIIWTVLFRFIRVLCPWIM